MTTNYAHKFTKTEWLIIALARECHLYMNFGKTNNKEVEKEKCQKKQQRQKILL